MTECVYIILNTENKKIYVGSTINFEKRKRSHLNGLRGRYHDNRRLQEEFDTYGEEAFEFIIIEHTNDENYRYELEEAIIQENKSYEKEFGYNLSIDGRGRYIITEETRQKMRENSLGERNPFYGKTHTKETKEKLSSLAKERYQGENNPFYGKTHTEETKEKIRETWKEKRDGGWVDPQKGVPKTEEEKHNNMMAQPARKEVFAEGKIYPSISACSKDLGIARSTVRNRINNTKFPDYYYI